MSTTPAVESRRADALAVDISGCRLCDAYGIPVTHLPPVAQPPQAELFIIGVQPEKADCETGHPFSGASGRRLLAWLVRAGVASTPTAAAARCRLASLARCHVPGGRRLTQVNQNCYAFLEREIGIVRPTICVTLGAEPLAALVGYRGPLEHVVGHSWTERAFGVDLFRILPTECPIIPLPSPAPGSSWLRRRGNAMRLRRALAALKRSLELAAPRVPRVRGTESSRSAA